MTCDNCRILELRKEQHIYNRTHRKKPNRLIGIQPNVKSTYDVVLIENAEIKEVLFQIDQIPQACNCHEGAFVESPEKLAA